MKSYRNLQSLESYVIKQLNNFFPTSNKIKKNQVKKEIKFSFERSVYCFEKIKTKYFNNNKSLHLNSEKYSIFLYFLSNELYKAKKIEIAEKAYYLNKILNGIDIFYEVEMPDIFYLIHPVGTVLGKAKYKNFFVAYQNCTVGANKNIFPNIEEYVTMRPGSKIIGNCRINSNCDIGLNAVVLDKNIKSNSIYLGDPNNFKIIANKKKNIWF